MDAISPDLRDRVLEAYDEQKQSRKEICARFKVSNSWLGGLLRRRRETGSTSAKPHTGNRPAPIAERVAAVQALIDQQPDATLKELTDRYNQQRQAHEFKHQQGQTLSVATISLAVQRADRPRKKSRSTPVRGTRRG